MKADQSNNGSIVVLEKEARSFEIPEKAYVNLCTANNISFYKGSVSSRKLTDTTIEYTVDFPRTMINNFSK